MVHVPYKGSGGVMTAILSGEIHLGFPYLPPAMPHVTSGRLRALAVTSQRRATTLPQVPTIAESALPGFDVTGWLGLSGPPNMPKEIVSLFEREIAKIVQDPSVKAQLVAQGAEPAGSTSQAFSEFIPAEIAKWAKVVKEAGIKVK